jgi:Flp pilus assembly protein TadD
MPHRIPATHNFRSGKLKAAELTLKKAVALSPKDEFTDTTLGIVF